MTGLIELTAAGRVAHLRFNQPERLNALSVEMAEAFAAAVARALADASVRVLLLSGAGRSFMAGGDVKAFAGASDKPALIAAMIDPLHTALKALAASPVITIAAAQGNIAGAGVSLVAFADLAIATEDATFTFAYSRIAGVPDCGGSWSLPRAIGLKAALGMALTNVPVGAAEASRMGLINAVVPADALLSEAEALIGLITAGPFAAQGFAKRLLRQSLDTSFDDQLDAERAAFVKGAALPDFAEGVSAFLERRPARFG